MIQLNRFPGGLKRAVTFSYDDGPIQDERLIALFNQYSVKGTFHLCGGWYRDKSAEDLEQIRKRYAGHEIAAHSLHHGFLTGMTEISMLREVLDDRATLEKIAGYPVVGMSYPYGDYNESVMRTLKSCGIVYSRTVSSTGDGTILPEDFLMWHPSCHHKDAIPVAERFMSSLDRETNRSVLYIWGHAHEFRTEDDWAHMERILSMVGGNEKIWYATNIEICDYTIAQRRLRISSDERMIYNPSAIPIWVERDKTEPIRIEPGEMLRL